MADYRVPQNTLPQTSRPGLCCYWNCKQISNCLIVQAISLR